MDIIEKIKKEGSRMKLSRFTIETYNSHIMDFFRFAKKDVSKVTKGDIRDYLNHLSDRKLSGNSMNVALASIKFMLRIQRKNWKIDTRYSRRPKAIPVFLTKTEIKKLLMAIQNKKHYLIVALLYSAGLRVSELINLKVKDLCISEGYGFVRHGKGNKDRIFIIARALRDEIDTWTHGADPESYVFSARNEMLSRKTVYVLVKYYSRLAGIRKNVHPHTLRHSFATHLVENNYQLETVQNVLGHESPQTTQVYIHAALPRFKIESPLDTIRETQAAYS
ncbi:MAG: tyrosine-type recombinase/integrase [Candidatus Woesearchaeota archaeon]|nr:tyrosine-type recombinase/integrase [Candidatus Woesearchaeota archaeon]